MKLKIRNGKVYIYLILGAIIFALYFMGNQSFTPFAAAPNTVFAQNSSSCSLKKLGDANCDGKVDEYDYNIWLEQYDGMVSPFPAEYNANFMCVSRNTKTYFADLTDYEIWRRHTVSGLITPTESPTNSPLPTITVNPPTNTPIVVNPTNTPIVMNPTNTPVPPTAGPTSPPPPPPRQSCSGDSDCAVGYCCASGGHCWPNNSAECGG